MSIAPEALPKRSIKERLFKTGASVGALLASALVIGEVPALASADKSAPRGDTPAKIESPVPKGNFIPYPPGLKRSDVLSQKDQVTVDALGAMAQKKVQWNGVLVVHKPTKYTAIGFTDSPRAYSNYAEPDWIFFGPDKNFSHDKSPQLIVSDPYLIQSKVGAHNRLFALVYTSDGRPAFLDLKFAEDMGGVTFYAYDGSTPRPMPVDQSNKSPNLDMEGNGRVLDNSKADATFVDSHTKLRYGHLSDVAPHM